MKNIRLIVASLAAVTALTATGGYAQAASAQTLSAHSVNWGDVTIPGQLCKVSGPIKLHHGRAFVRHSGFGMALDVLTTTVTHGYLAHGLPVTALQIWCIAGGTADGELAEGVMVFDSPGGKAHLLGTLTPQHKTSAMVHIPSIVVNRIETTGHVAVTEFFYTPGNMTCCPTGRATTLWKWTGRKFIPGRTKITSGLSGSVIPGDDRLHRQSQPKIAVRADARPSAFRVTWTQGNAQEPTEGIGDDRGTGPIETLRRQASRR